MIVPVAEPGQFGPSSVRKFAQGLDVAAQASLSSNRSDPRSPCGVTRSNPIANDHLEGHLLPAGLDIISLQLLLDSANASSSTGDPTSSGVLAMACSLEARTPAPAVDDVTPDLRFMTRDQLVKLCQPEDLMSDVEGLTVIGQGSRSVVCQALWRGARVAVKFTACGSLDPATSATIRQALVSKALAHPNVLQHYSVRCCRLQLPRQSSAGNPATAVAVATSRASSANYAAAAAAVLAGPSSNSSPFAPNALSFPGATPPSGVGPPALTITAADGTQGSDLISGLTEPMVAAAVPITCPQHQNVVQPAKAGSQRVQLSSELRTRRLLCPTAETGALRAVRSMETARTSGTFGADDVVAKVVEELGGVYKGLSRTAPVGATVEGWISTAVVTSAAAAIADIGQPCGTPGGGDGAARPAAAGACVTIVGAQGCTPVPPQDATDATPSAANAASAAASASTTPIGDAAAVAAAPEGAGLSASPQGIAVGADERQEAAVAIASQSPAGAVQIGAPCNPGAAAGVTAGSLASPRPAAGVQGGASPGNLSFNSYEGFGNPFGNLRHALSLPHVAALVSAREGDYLTAIIMEHADKGTLLRAVQRGVFLPNKVWSSRVALRALLRTALEVAFALQHLHSRSVVHGALRPTNVLLRSSNIDRRGFTAKVTNFSLARVCCGSLDEYPLTAAAGQLGSGGAAASNVGSAGAVDSADALAAAISPAALPFMAPEQLMGGLGKPSDVYAFGMTLYFMATDTLPYKDIPPRAIVEGVLSGGLKPVWPEGPTAVPQLRALCAQCWSPDPRHRPTFSHICKSLQAIEHALRQQLRKTASSNASGNHVDSPYSSGPQAIQPAVHVQQQGGGVDATVASGAAPRVSAAAAAAAAGVGVVDGENRRGGG